MNDFSKTSEVSEGPTYFSKVLEAPESLRSFSYFLFKNFAYTFGLFSTSDGVVSPKPFSNVGIQNLVYNFSFFPYQMEW